MHLHHLNHPSDSAAHSGESSFLATTENIIYYFEIHDESTAPPIQRIIRFNFTPPFGHFKFVGSCNGLICLVDIFSESVWICNPITRESVMLPEIKRDCDIDGYSYGNSIGFGYVSSKNDYKVVGIYVLKTKIHVYVYTLGSGNGWRNLGNFNFDLNFALDSDNLYEAGIFANGAVYWLDTKFGMIITFDLGVEQFCEHFSPPPLPPDSDWCNARLGILDGFLYFSVYLQVEQKGWVNDIFLLKKKNHNGVMKEGEEHQSLVWSKEFRIDDSKLIAVTKSDCVLTYSGHYLQIYDTKTSTSKGLAKFMIPGLCEVFPHQNTLVSLKELGEEDTKGMESVKIEET